MIKLMSNGEKLMANNVYRLITNMRKNPTTRSLINAMGNKFDSYAMGSNTPFINQILETSSNGADRPTCLYFTPTATLQLKKIRELAQEKFKYRKKEGKEDRPIDFLCYGYQDFAGDIVIDFLEIPYMKGTPSADFYSTLFKLNPSAVANEKMNTAFHNYLSQSTIGREKNTIGLMPVAFYGTTRPIVATTDNTQNCPRFSEVSKAIVSTKTKFKQPIKTGLLSISPKTIEQTPNGAIYRDGSLECVVIDYNVNQNGLATPSQFSNIIHCQQTEQNGQRTIVDISKSYQPTTGLPNYSNQMVK